MLGGLSSTGHASWIFWWLGGWEILGAKGISQAHVAQMMMMTRRRRTGLGNYSDDDPTQQPFFFVWGPSWCRCVSVSVGGLGFRFVLRFNCVSVAWDGHVLLLFNSANYPTFTGQDTAPSAISISHSLIGDLCIHSLPRSCPVRINFFK
ncbi:hypothetical protein CRG98_031968 [Punica granatum]|uniref:Uncharacterized protein n=1 Tax=Punica granatum TaxID=22663 RepID=A0A2I0IUK7_PUNGR|nr:hypothetical protein CRG98_031968 [Punica granatum]